MVTKQYSDDSIKSLSDIQHMRLRPSAYAPDTGVAGQFQLCKEIIDNSTDELELQPEDGLLEIFIFKNNTRSRYQVMVIDNGRGVPIGKLIDSFACGKTSGKFDTDSYQFSSGTFGVGSTLVVALSNWFRAITLNSGLIGDVTIHHDDIPTDIPTIKNNTGSRGTVVMFEPDPTILSDIGGFMADHSLLTNYLSQISLFAKYRIKLTIINGEITDDVKKSETLDMLKFIEYIRESNPTFDSLTFNRDEYVQQFFDLTRDWTKEYHTEYTSPDGKLIVDTHLGLISTAANVPANTKLTFVNNILFSDSASLHTSMMTALIKKKITPMIGDVNIKKFFKDQYKLPIWMIMNVKFAGAQFTGLTKHSFRDVTFKDPYTKALDVTLNNGFFAEVFGLIQDNIVAQYNKFSNKDLKVSNMRHLLAELNRPSKFNDCSTTNRREAELFLVEGDSAKPDKARDSKFQASYTLGGKPLNGLTTVDKLSASVNTIKQHHIFQDIIKILAITPGSDDLSRLNFGKIVVMTDADTHGYHIQNIILGNLLAICPALLEGGYLHAVIPPLFGLKISGRKDKLFIRNEVELNATLAYHLYYRCFDITIESDQYRKTLTREEFVAFSEIIDKVGEAIATLSKEYYIPAALLEQLSLMTRYIDLKVPNIGKLSECLGCPVRYSGDGNILIISIGSEDIIVPLTQICDLIYTRILPLYREFYYGKTRLYITTKRSTFMKDAPISVVQIYQMFKQLSGLFTIERYKGLGSMIPEDSKVTCMNPDTRRTYQINSIGDVDRIFQMLGKDSQYRKQLVID